MDCGIPYCHTGCPVNNQIPDWNDLVYHSDWEVAAQNLHSTNNFPEVTGRICPAPCEAACTLNIIDVPVTIKSIECAIADKAFDEGWVTPVPPETKTGKRVAVVGSGPAGLAAAQQLARAGHDVHVYEKNAFPGGLLRYGIPDFKMEKYIVERRVKQMEAEGVTFHCNVHVGRDLSVKKLERDYDAVLLAGGAEHPRDLAVPGRDLKGIHFAMNFLPQQNRRVSGEPQGDVAPDPRRGQARRGDRRWRYRLRLHRHVVPSGRGLGDPARDPARAAGEGEQSADLAELAAQAAHLIEPGGRRRARLQRGNQPVPGRQRQGRAARMHPPRRAD